MNDFSNTNNSNYNLKQDYVGESLKKKRQKLADTRLGEIKDQFNEENTISRALNEDRNSSKT